MENLTISQMYPIKSGELILDPDPIKAFSNWLQDAKDNNLPEPTSMSLATADQLGRVSARIVLLKGVSNEDPKGFEFYTNYLSPKSKDIGVNASAALCFHWVALRRQVRIEGLISKLSTEESDRYFETRPRGSQVGAWASLQSSQIESRQQLESAVKTAEERFAGKLVPRPPHWGGWKLTPDRIEFWEERPFRLHERFEYLKNNSRACVWNRRRLSP